MKTRNVVLAAVVGLVLAWMLPGPAGAQDDETYSTYGQVVKATANQIVINEYDIEKETMVDVTYPLDPKVKLKNVTALKDLAAGQSVDLTYVIKDGKNVVTEIVVDLSSGDETPEEGK